MRTKWKARLVVGGTDRRNVHVQPLTLFIANEHGEFAHERVSSGAWPPSARDDHPAPPCEDRPDDSTEGGSSVGWVLTSSAKEIRAPPDKKN